MSIVKVQGNASGTGIFTVASPNSNTDRTLTLPDNTGTVLTNASNLAGLTGVGKVLQVVTATSTSQYSHTSTSWVSTGFSVSITPSSSSNKVFVMLMSGMADVEPSRQSQFTFYRNSTTNLGDTSRGLSQMYSASGRQQSPISFGLVDSPSSTSSTTYTIYMKANTTDTVYLNTDNCLLTIVAMEIAA